MVNWGIFNNSCFQKNRKEQRLTHCHLWTMLTSLYSHDLLPRLTLGNPGSLHFLFDFGGLKAGGVESGHPGRQFGLEAFSGASWESHFSAPCVNSAPSQATTPLSLPWNLEPQALSHFPRCFPALHSLLGWHIACANCSEEGPCFFFSFPSFPPCRSVCVCVRLCETFSFFWLSKCTLNKWKPYMSSTWWKIWKSWKVGRKQLLRI